MKSNIAENIGRIVVIRLDNIGDVIMTGPALRAIKAALPDAHLTLLGSPGGAQAAALLPWVDDVLIWRALWQDLGQLPFDPAREWELVAKLRAGPFDMAIIFTSFRQSPHAAAFICQLAGIPLRIGQSKETAAGLLTTELSSPPDEMHQVERNLRLVEAIGCHVQDRSLAITIPAAAQQAADGQLQKHGLAANAPYLLLNLWASCQARTYNGVRFAMAARQLAAKTGCRVVVTGLSRDRPGSGAALYMLGNYAIDLIGQTSVAELAALVANARLLLTNHTLTMHLADATCTASVVLFAGTDLESQWQPRAAPVRLLRQPTDCRPCYAFRCPYNHECLDIAPEIITAVGLELLGRLSKKQRTVEAGGALD